MNSIDRRLDRLFRAASRVAPDADERLPHYVEKSILSHWNLMHLPIKEIWATEFYIPALAASVAVLLVVQLWNSWMPLTVFSDNQFTLIAIYKIWNL